MALSASTVFEVRTTGSDSNGGGFVTGASGTDYSQQDTAQYALTGLTTAAANAIILTASAAAAMVGNLINITGGTNFITGVYQITAVSAGVSITVDRNCTSAAGTAGLGNVGGAAATLGAIATVAADQNICYIKGSSYNVGAVITPWASGIIEGYTTTRGDNGVVTLVATAAIKIFTLTNGSAVSTLVFRNLALNGNAVGISGWEFGTSNRQSLNSLSNCRAYGFTSHGISHIYYDYVSCVNCKFDSNGGSGYSQTGGAGIVSLVGCIFSGNTGDGFVDFQSGTISQCIFSGNGGRGLLISFNAFAQLVSNCVFYANTSDGLVMGRTGFSYEFAQTAINCIFYGNGGYGLNVLSSLPLFSVWMRNCAVGSNTSGATTLDAARQLNTVTMTGGNPFVNAAGGDFSLNNTIGAGEACRAAGFYGVFLGAATTGYQDIGAVQHQDSPAIINTNIIQRKRKVR